jgi:anti-sigma regulatory factor (Ser/Thr protein kinase)
MAESIGVSLDARDRLLLEEGCSNTGHSKGKQATVEINISPRLYELTIVDEGLRDSESEKNLVEKLEEVKEIIAGKKNFDFESPNGRGILMMMQTAKVTYDFGIGKKTTIHIVRDKTKK